MRVLAPAAARTRGVEASQPQIGFAAAHKKFFWQVPEVFPVFLSSFAAT
jgi:hypothetical protein